MSQKNKWQKQCEKKLSLENLESRQLLSAVPFTANPDYTDSTAYLATNDDVAVDYTVAEDALAADVQFEDDNIDEQEQAVTVTANANKLAIQFAADANEQFTVVVKGTDAATNKVTTAFKSVKASAKNIQGGIFTYNFTGKVNYNYEVFVANGKYTAKDLAATGGIIPEGILVGSDTVTTLAPFSFVASSGKATAHSITFQQKNGQAIESLEGWTVSAKFDGAKQATVYTVDEDGALVNGGNASNYSITLNDGGTVTISGLQLNTKQTFQVSQSTADAVSAYSSNLSISTTKEQKAPPACVWAYLNADDVFDYDGKAVVRWVGELDSTYTVAYSYTDAKGKVVTKNATTKATVDPEWHSLDEYMYEGYYGSFTVSKLAPGTEYTFSVSTNKTKDYDASVFVAQTTVARDPETGYYNVPDTTTTPVVIPAPTLKKVSVTDHSVTFQITNWNKIEAALQEVFISDDGSNDHFGGDILIMDGKSDNLLTQFTYNSNEGWKVLDGDCDGIMECSVVNKKSIATITIDDLEANTDYNFQAIAYNELSEKEVAAATSKTLKAKTSIAANEAPAWVEAELVTDEAGGYTGDVAVAWAGEAGVTYTVNYTYTDAKGKEITKTATKKATVNNEGDDEFVVTKLQGGQKYTFSVSANKDKEHSASEFVAAEEILTTPTAIPAPTLKKVSVTATSVTFQITNWDKMATALQEREGENGTGGFIYVMENGAMIGQDEAITSFLYDFDADENLGWQYEDSNYAGTMDITNVKNKNIATITINGLEANKDYNFQVTAFSNVQNDNINTVATVTSKAFKFKTAK